MGAVSNTLYLGCIDAIAAILKAQKTAVSQTETLYAKITREDNVDDLVGASGATYAYNADVALQAGTVLRSQVEQFCESFLTKRAIDAGSTSIADLLADRYLRVPKAFDTYYYYPAKASHIDDDNLFEDTAVTFGTFGHGGEFAAGSDLSAEVSLAWGLVKTGSVIGESDWVLAIDVVYSDASEGTEAVTVTGESALNTEFNIGANAVTGLSVAGQKIVLMSTTTGMVAGQKVLLSDPLYSSLLTANASSGQAIIYVDPTQVGAFRTSDSVTIRDTSHNENVDIDEIDYTTGKITLASNLSNSYTTAAEAFIYLQAASTDAKRPGWQEMQEIDSVSASTSITMVGDLQHAYYTGAVAVRLIASVADVATTSGGTTGDAVSVLSKVERVPTQ